MLNVVNPPVVGLRNCEKGAEFSFWCQREEELVRAWWKEYGESREGPSNANSTHDAHSGEAGHLSQADRNDFESGRVSQLNAWEEEENVGVLVKGGLYEVCTTHFAQSHFPLLVRNHLFAFSKNGFVQKQCFELRMIQFGFASKHRKWSFTIIGASVITSRGSDW